MREKQGWTHCVTLAVVLLASLFFAGVISAQPNQGPPAFVGKFTLSQETRWGKSILPPGTYTLTIDSTSAPIIAVIHRVDGGAAFFAVSQAHSDKTNGVNALTLRGEEGKPRVSSLALADIGMVLVYDPSSGRTATRIARASQTVPVLSAKN